MPPSLQTQLYDVAEPLPDPGDPPAVFEAYNAAAEAAYKAAVPKCPECLQSFKPERLLKHMRKCCLGRFETTAAAISDFMTAYGAGV